MWPKVCGHVIAEQEKHPGNHYIFMGGSHTSGRMVFLFWGEGFSFKLYQNIINKFTCRER